VTSCLDDANTSYSTYDGVLPNPPIQVVEACIEAYCDGGCDSIVIVGGGSSIDTAKCAGVLATNGVKSNHISARAKSRNGYHIRSQFRPLMERGAR
jgi:alcohol dehydrogenase class IV